MVSLSRGSGLTIFFTGLSGAGKTTLAGALQAQLRDIDARAVRLLDGDVVRRALSSELGFSRQDRDLQVQRVGYVAAEITASGAIALCAVIAPYAAARAGVRAMVEAVGTFVLVHVATPLSVCEQRDPKGLYARARAGELTHFTGISDPYEAPTDADIVVDTTGATAAESAAELIAALMDRGHLHASVAAEHGEEKGRVRDPLHDAQAGLAECVKDLSWHRDTQRVQEAVTRLAIDSTTVASGQFDAMRARTGVLADAIAAAPQPVQSKSGRAWSTLRSLGITPSALVRRPRGLRTLLRLAARPRAVRDAHLVSHSGVFDTSYYLRRYPDVVSSGMTPLAHFIFEGGAAGRQPSPLFDSAWFVRQNDVAGSGVNPLAQYLRMIAGDARDPHPLFSVSHYRSQVAESGAQAFEPLQHYARYGALKGHSPHPLFDARYYVETYGRSAAAIDPLAHFLDEGAAAGYNPHPLFDVAYYRAQAPDAAAQNPLIHYLAIGSAQGLRPHPLFDPAYYRAANPDVAAAKVDPLTHFVLAGGLEGRRPIRDFDSAWYLQSYADVGASRMNPLTHFVRHGWREHRNPSPQFDTIGYLVRYPDVAEAGTNPLAHYVQTGRAEGRLTGPHERAVRRIESDRRIALRASRLHGEPPSGRVVVCLTHVMPATPRAGNQYRIMRMLRWLRATGYVVIPVVAPIGDERPTAAEIRALADALGNAVVCQTDGRLEYVLRDIPDVLASLDGKFSKRWATPLGEDLQTTVRQRELLQVDRSFCTDALIDTVMRLQTVLGPFVVLAEYIWMSRLLPLLDGRALKIIDTIDVFSTRAEKVDRFGVEDLTIEATDERHRLERADVIVAIQENERAVLESLAPSLPVITSGVDFDVVADPGVPTGTTVLCVASDNPMNRRGLQDFLRLAWPRIRELVPAAELQVVGAVGESIASPPHGVSILGQVADLKPLYAGCRVVINPAMAGTGVKIKTLEALSHLRPVVTWPNGVDGVAREVAALCRIVADWDGFAREVADTLTSDRALGFSVIARETMERESQPARVYAELGRVMNEFFATDHSRPARRTT